MQQTNHLASAVSRGIQHACKYICLKSNIYGFVLSEDASQIGDIVKANAAVHQLSNPYQSLMTIEIAKHLPLIAIGFYLIALAIVALIVKDIYDWVKPN